VISKISGKCIIFNPQDHKLNFSKEYTYWDLHFVEQADIVFAYLEKENPSGFGLTLEIGFANRIAVFASARTPLCKTFRLNRRIIFSLASRSSFRVTCTILLGIVTEIHNSCNYAFDSMCSICPSTERIPRHSFIFG